MSEMPLMGTAWRKLEVSVGVDHTRRLSNAKPVSNRRLKNT
jgi:hypothetical protein